MDERNVKLCVHRKGAIRAFPPGHPDIPDRYQGIGQPVLIPGDMGRYSFLAVGAAAALEESFGSTCHGAGRAASARRPNAFSRGATFRQRWPSRV